jgi:pantetheine-phosphate adenylyltransferase
MRRAVYAGTFDLLTIGHEWMIQTGATMFDELLVAVAHNPDKKTMFDTTTRHLMLSRCCSDLKNVRIHTMEKEFLVRWAKRFGCNYLLRGIRNIADFQYEQTMANVNADWEPDITTVFLKGTDKLERISSSFVKGLIGFEGWEAEVVKFVPSCVFPFLKDNYDRQQAEIESKSGR